MLLSLIYELQVCGKVRVVVFSVDIFTEIV